MNSNKILELISEKNIEFVQIDVPDLSGLRRNVICHVGHFTESIMEKGFPYRLLGGFQVDGEIIMKLISPRVFWCLIWKVFKFSHG